MSVPKQRRSKSKNKIRRNIWYKKANTYINENILKNVLNTNQKYYNKKFENFIFQVGTILKTKIEKE